MMKTLSRTILALLIIAFLSAPLLTIVPVKEADAWIAHGCCARECTKKVWFLTITYCCESTVYWHLNPFSHDWECPEPGC